MSHKKIFTLQFKQQGNSLIGLMAGLVLATLILIAVLLVLNSNSKRDFKQEPALNNASNTASASKDKLMLPQAASQISQVESTNHSASESTMSSQTASETIGESVLSVHDNKYPESNQNAVDSNNTVNTVNTNDGTAGVVEDKKADSMAVPPKTTGLSNSQQEDKFRQPSHNLNKNGNNNTSSWRDDNSDSGVSKNHNSINNAHTIKRTPDLPTLVDKNGALIEHPSTTSKKIPNYRPMRPSNNDKVIVAKPKPQVVKPQQPKASVQTNIKPSPELILESGNIEKAREAARRQAATKNNTVKPSENKKPAVQAATTTTQHGNVVLQAGSFVNVRSADAQRARLAMMGIQAKVVEAQVNGKSVYRVQTHGLNGNKATETKNTLQRNGIQVYQHANH